MYFGFHVNCLNFCPILTKFGFSRQIFIKVPITKFHGNPSNGRCTYKCRQPDRHDEDNRRFLRVFRGALTLKHLSQRHLFYHNSRMDWHGIECMCQIFFFNLLNFRASAQVKAKKVLLTLVGYV
jgi:hypothetical protein